MPKKQKRILQNAKQELRDVFGRAWVERVAVKVLTTVRLRVAG